MLQAQIKPHFIYNTLDVIKWSVKLGQQEETIRVVTNLARLLRFSIDSAEEFLTIRSNIEFINSYLAIQRIKYNNSFDIVTDIDDTLMDCKIPRLILQPFIENAIIHGFGKTNRTDGIIKITGQFCQCGSDEEESHGRRIEFRISDNGIGITEQELEELAFEGPENHLGIYNVDKRIKMYFGEDFGVRIHRQSQGTQVIITMPSTMTGDFL
jgi:two-component system, sensor histidine kinase YesM